MEAGEQVCTCSELVSKLFVFLGKQECDILTLSTLGEKIRGKSKRSADQHLIL